MPLSGSLPFLTSFLEILRPAKSPHLVASSFGVVCLSVVSDDKYVSELDRFLFIGIAAVLALVVVVGFSFGDRITKESSNSDVNIQEEMENQFKFSRSMGIGSSLLALMLTGILMEDGSRALFNLAGGVSAVQLLTFMAYSTIRLKKEEIESELKIFEMSFIMFVMLVGFVYCLSEVSMRETKEKPYEFDMRFAFSAAVLFFLWLRYEVFWVRRMIQIVEIRVH